jgi:hypothetical protein
MKVKVGDNIYVSSKQPICIILQKNEMDELFDMVGKRLVRYVSFPKGMNEEEIRKWMGDFT